MGQVLKEKSFEEVTRGDPLGAHSTLRTTTGEMEQGKEKTDVSPRCTMVGEGEGFHGSQARWTAEGR